MTRQDRMQGQAQHRQRPRLVAHTPSSASCPCAHSPASCPPSKPPQRLDHQPLTVDFTHPQSGVCLSLTQESRETVAYSGQCPTPRATPPQPAGEALPWASPPASQMRPKAPTPKGSAAVELGRRGKGGGKARAAKLSTKKKHAIARRAAQVRWDSENNLP